MTTEMGAANSPPQPPAPGLAPIVSTTTTITTTTTTAAENASAADSSQQQLPSSPGATTNSAIGKRKRTPSPPPPTSNFSPQFSLAKKKLDNSDMTVTLEDKASQRLLFVKSIMQDLLIFFKANDPVPSVIAHPIPSASPSPHGGPPSKRTKLSPSTPNTIADRLSQGFYTSLTTVLSDVESVCRELLASAEGSTGNGLLTNGAGPVTGGTPLVAQILHFEESAKQIITRERVRRADLFDFVKEMTGDRAIAKPVTKVALTVMGQHGPLFSSLQNPVVVPLSNDSAPSSRATSMSASPKSSSTAPTSTAASPKAIPLKVYPVYTSLDESSLPPLISTVKAIPSGSQAGTAAVKMDLPGKGGTKVVTLGEAFPPPRGLTPLTPPKPLQPGSVGVGLKWGGKIGIGGVRLENPMNDLPESCGEWLRYRNHPPRNHPKARRELVRLGMGLPADVVAAYSSFAPTRDDSGSKVPAATRSRVWWDRVGRQAFRREFARDPGIGHMFKQNDEKSVDEAGEDVEIVEEEEKDLEEVFRKAIDEWEPEETIPIDFRLLDGSKEGEAAGPVDQDEFLPEKILPEISNLLQSLRSQQYIRLSTVPPVPPPKAGNGATPVLGTPSTPSEEELILYNTIKDRLALLISKLPPHLVATVDGEASGDLNVSTKVPIFEGGSAVFNGMLPGDDAHLPKTSQVQGAAMAAMNAAAGLSPVQPMNSAPVAMMTTPIRQNVPVPPPPQSTRVVGGLANISVGTSAPPSYHGHQLPQQQQQQHYHGHGIPQSGATTQTQSVTTPHHYPSPYAPLPSPSSPFPPHYQHPPPPRVVSPLHHHRQTPHSQTPQFHGHSMPPSYTNHNHQQPHQQPGPQTPFGAMANVPHQSQSRRTTVSVPPVQGLEAVGVGYGVNAGYGSNSNAGLRMGVQHTQQSMSGGNGNGNSNGNGSGSVISGGGPLPGGRFVRARR